MKNTFANAVPKPQVAPENMLTVKDIIEKFFGDLSRWPVEPDGLNFTQSQIQAVCQHIFETGDCLWHAQYIVMKWEICHCADCCGVNSGGKNAKQ